MHPGAGTYVFGVDQRKGRNGKESVGDVQALYKVAQYFFKKKTALRKLNLKEIYIRHFGR